MYLLRYCVLLHNELTQNLRGFMQQKSVSHSCYTPLANQLGTLFCVTVILTWGPKLKEQLPSGTVCGLNRRKRSKSSRTLPHNSSAQRRGTMLPLTLSWQKQNPSGRGGARLSLSGERESPNDPYSHVSREPLRSRMERSAL